ncbi:beta-ketoacyl synthase N-terminal-like domain-containing protein [Archangium sp.]|uniref:beta-ketoacyl synthase N-terminal-like domain-containing protein n=1 Tax=Archangium sp. TaxID=1872627 RepID=UPI002D75724E|nr:beta-ketoacyl synthase N-terminal-like domain-containing protein [Archangium sp.]HYO53651.1 beta-ketoacyl synthase N-terminal-like domain-containing protein [Archangium sp.]
MSAASVRARIVRFAEHPYLLDMAGEPMVLAPASYVSPDASGVARYLALALPALQEALAPLQRLALKGMRVPLFLGLPPSRPGLPRSLPETLCAELGRRGGPWIHPERIQVFQAGHSAGLLALKEARQWLLRREGPLCLVGGVDSYLEPETLEWLDGRGQLKSNTSRWGFVPGEAAGFCLLASPEEVKSCGLEPLAQILSVATAIEQSRAVPGVVCMGVGLTRAMREALEALPDSERVEQVICDLNGERYRTDEYGFTVVRLQERFVDATEAWTPADCWGDVGAASGPLFLGLAVASSQRGYARGARVLAWTSSEQGERSSALLELPDRPESKSNHRYNGGPPEGSRGLVPGGAMGRTGR